MCACLSYLVVWNSRTCLLLVNHSVARVFSDPLAYLRYRARRRRIALRTTHPLAYMHARTYKHTRTHKHAWFRFKDIGWSAGRTIKSNLIEFRACVRPVTRSRVSRHQRCGIFRPYCRWTGAPAGSPGFDVATNYSLMSETRDMGFIN